jgi:sulfite exporter TauE/SafE
MGVSGQMDNRETVINCAAVVILVAGLIILFFFGVRHKQAEMDRAKQPLHEIVRP